LALPAAVAGCAACGNLGKITRWCDLEPIDNRHIND
jgi:hypothetical protein